MAYADVILINGFASVHLVNLLMVTKRWVKPPGAFGRGPTLSNLQTVKGRVMGMV